MERTEEVEEEAAGVDEDTAVADAVLELAEGVVATFEELDGDAEVEDAAVEGEVTMLGEEPMVTVPVFERVVVMVT